MILEESESEALELETNGTSITEDASPPASREGSSAARAITNGTQGSSMLFFRVYSSDLCSDPLDFNCLDQEMHDFLHSLNREAAGAPGSLPIEIRLRNRTREALSLASYQPQNAMPQAAEDKAPASAGHGKSATANRKAMYAERDRTRAVDPGTLDLLDDDEDDEDEDDTSSDDDLWNPEEQRKIKALLSTSRGQRKALKIIRRANKLPEAGMWRSLAS